MIDTVLTNYLFCGIKKEMGATISEADRRNAVTCSY